MRMVEPLPESTDDPRLDTAGEKTHSQSVLESGLSAVRTVLAGLWHGIPIELAFVVAPEKKIALLDEFNLQAKNAPIKKQVSAMLRLLDKYFPELEVHSTKWMSVCAHFFGCVGLWGKFG